MNIAVAVAGTCAELFTVVRGVVQVYGYCIILKISLVVSGIATTIESTLRLAIELVREIGNTSTVVADNAIRVADVAVTKAGAVAKDVVSSVGFKTGAKIGGYVLGACAIGGLVYGLGSYVVRRVNRRD